jgi:hypothetical protein
VVHNRHADGKELFKKGEQKRKSKGTAFSATMSEKKGASKAGGGKASSSPQQTATEEQRCLYAIKWQADSAATAATPAPPTLAAICSRGSAAAASATRMFASALGMLQEAAASSSEMGKVQLGTMGAQPVGMGPASSAGARGSTPQAGLWALLRSVVAERPQLACSGVDCAAAAAAWAQPLRAGAVSSSHLQASSAYGCAVRGATLLVARLVRSEAAPWVGDVQVVALPRGSLSALALQPVPTSTLMTTLLVHWRLTMC